MIIHDGKRLEINIGGISQSQLEKILQEHGKNILDGLGKKLGEIPKSTVIYGGENQDPDERTISTSKGEGGITKNPKKLRKQQIMGEHWRPLSQP